jgi:AcrR family transcriptional regulator
MGRHRVHDDRTAAALLDASEEILQYEGLEGLSVRRVAEKVGTTTRAVYSSLGSKDALLAELGVRAFESLGAHVATLPRSKDPVVDLVNAGTLGFRRWALAHPALFRVAFLELSISAKAAQRFTPHAQRALQSLHALIADVNATDGLGGRSIEMATSQFHSLCEGLVIMELRCESPDPDDETMRLLWTDALTALVTGWRHTAPRATR